jgi:hypothetical protein
LFYDILGNYYVLKKTFKPKSPIGNIKEITLSISTERPLKRCFVKTPIFSCEDSNLQLRRLQSSAEKIGVFSREHWSLHPRRLYALSVKLDVIKN